MPKKRRLKPSSKRKAVQEVVHPNAAGIDIGAEQSYVSVPADRDEKPVRSFGCFTEDLHALARWLQAGLMKIAPSRPTLLSQFCSAGLER